MPFNHQKNPKFSKNPSAQAAQRVIFRKFGLFL
jgi:hypothetical protein